MEDEKLLDKLCEALEDALKSYNNFNYPGRNNVEVSFNELKDNAETFPVLDREEDGEPLQVKPLESPL